MIPWGYKLASDGRHLVGIATHKERMDRMALGEFAIALFERMNVSAEMLLTVSSAEDPLGALAALQGTT